MTQVKKPEKRIKIKAIYPFVERFRADEKWSYSEYDIAGTWSDVMVYNTSQDTAKLRENLRHITPQERFDAFYKKPKPEEENQSIESFVPRSAQDGTCHATFNTSANFRVHELVYPGDRSEPVADKWIYAIHTGSSKILAEIFAVSEAEVYCRYNPTFQAGYNEPQPDVLMKDGLIKLPVNACDVGTDIGFFISPFRFSKEAAEFLTSNKQRLKNSVVCAVRQSTELLYAAVPDPYRWTEDAHAKFFAPLLNQWQSFVLDPLRQARLFIASAVKSGLQSEQIRFLQDKIYIQKGQPDKFLSKYKQDEEKLRITAEVAAAYLYNCCDAPEHRAVEAAAVNHDEEALAHEFIHWAVVSDRLIETAQGRRFAQMVAEQPNRVPTKFFFPDQSEEGILSRLEEMFPNTRFGWQASMAIVAEWAPAHFANAKNVDPLRKIINALEHLGLKEGAKAVAPKKFKAMHKGSQKIVNLLYKNTTQMVSDADSMIPSRNPVTSIYAGATKYDSKLIDDFVEKVENMQMTQRVKRVQPSLVTRSAKRLDGVYESYFKNVRVPLSVAIELINTLNSVNALIDEKDPNEGIFKAIGMVGSAGDFMSSLAGTAGKFFEKRADRAAENALKYAAAAEDARVSPAFRQVAGEMANDAEIAAHGWKIWGTRVQIGFGVIGMIAGTCQAIDEAKQTSDAVKIREYGIAAGHGIATFGAGLTVVGGGISVAALVTGSASTAAFLGPVGVIVSVVGSVLIFAGNIIASLLTPNAFEQFAKFCFLGDDYGVVDKVKLDWAEKELPTFDIYQECRELLRIICSFQMELDETFMQYHPPSREIPYRFDISLLASMVKLRVGYLTPTAAMRIVVEHGYKVGKETKAFKANFTLLPESGELIQEKDDVVLENKGNHVFRDETGAINLVHLNLTPLKVKTLERGEIEHAKWLNTGARPLYCRVKVRAEMPTEDLYIPSKSGYVQIETTEDEIQSKTNQRISSPSYRSFGMIQGKDRYGRPIRSGPANKSVTSLDQGVAVE